MNRLTDKLILLTLCLTCYFQYAGGGYVVIPVLCAVAAAALGSWLAEKPAVILPVYLVYCAACVAFPLFLLFLPLICYDVLGTRLRYAALAGLVPVAAHLAAFPPVAFLYVGLFAVLSVFFRLRADSLEKLRVDYIYLRDSTKEFSLQLENKNKELLEKQDYEVHLATLNERNRIARDIHDNIGHLLSNAILQTGALMASTRDEEQRARLETLRDTLSQGMDSIRSSIHNLHDESVDLYSEIRSLVESFRFCPVTLDYGISGNPDRKVKYALLAIAKEALSNIARHSNATEARLSFLEHPALYQLVVRDNGTKKAPEGEGIGLKNIEQRVSGLNGVLTIDRSGGFTVFVSIPKERAL